ncbi:MAG: glycosyltransferase family 2 protein [Prochlorococcaceae cyanobacterium]
MTPLVSAIIPTFNRERTIARAVQSALDQTYGNIEVIIVDDGSRDGTAEALRQFGREIVVLQQENGGPSLARNFGASKARGSILAFLDSDDEWLPEKIDKQVGMMQSYGPSMPCCICNATYTHGREISAGTSFGLAGLTTEYDNAILENPVAVLISTFLLFNQVAAIRREAFENVGGFAATLRLMEDYELSLRLATLGPWGVLRESLVLKHEETLGIGVTAMKDEVMHLAAKETVLKCILANPSLQQASIRVPLTANLRQVRRQQSVHRWMLKVPRPLRLAGHAVFLLDRICKAVARRLPGTHHPRMHQA